jgi:hypothetical protein
VLYHTPFPKMAAKAHRRLLELDRGAAPTDAEYDASYATLVAPGLAGVSQIGNTYTASLYLCLATILEAEAKAVAGRRLGLFSYGSGCCAEFFAGVVPPAATTIGSTGIRDALARRTLVDVETYERLVRHGDKGGEPAGRLHRRLPLPRRPRRPPPLRAGARGPGRMTALAAAYAECAALARSHYENFPIGLVAPSAPPPDDLAAVYAFARLGDDVADEGDAPPAVRLERLAEIDAQLVACAADPPPRAIRCSWRSATRSRATRCRWRRSATCWPRSGATPPATRIASRRSTTCWRTAAARRTRSAASCSASSATATPSAPRARTTSAPRSSSRTSGRTSAATSIGAAASTSPTKTSTVSPARATRSPSRRTNPGPSATASPFEVEPHARALRGAVSRWPTWSTGRLAGKSGSSRTAGSRSSIAFEAHDYDVLAVRPKLGRSDFARLVWKELWA